MSICFKSASQTCNIGKKRSAMLLSRFGSVKNLSNASIDEIVSLPGIREDLAKTIYDFFRH